MTISDVIKIRWYKDVEEFEKWYNAQIELETFATKRNPLAKLFTNRELNALILNTQYYYDESGFLWDQDKEKAIQKKALPLLRKLVLKTEKYIHKIKVLRAKIRELEIIDNKVFQEIESVFRVLWSIFLSDLGKPLSIYLEEVLTKRGLTPKEKDKIIDYCFNFKHPLGFQKEEKELKQIYYKIPKRHRKNNIDFENLPPLIQQFFNAHCQKYQYLTTLWLNTQPLRPKDFFKKSLVVRSCKEPRRTRKIPNKIKKNLNGKDLELLYLTHRHIFLDNFASDLYQEIEFTLSKYLTQIFSISFKDLSWYSVDELKELVANGKKLNKNQLRQRKKYRVIAQIDGEIGMFYGYRNFKQIEKIVNNKKSMSKVIVLKGLVASRGLVRGRVKIVRETKDVKKIEKGDLLVATMTHPDLMLAIQKCAGIITDTGGMTSHAAIISREFKIPCVVGTNIATSVLKNGDFVELNANIGEVRILKS